MEWQGLSSSRQAARAVTSSPASPSPTSCGVATPRRASSSLAHPAASSRGSCPRSGYELVLLPILPLNGVGVARALRGLLALPVALVRAVALVRRERPAAVLGIGGYAGGPVVLVAALLGVRTVILEPNAKPGFTNRVLGPFVDQAACAYEEARACFGGKGVVTGTPVRGGFAALPAKTHGTPPTLLAFGGSQGSRVLNEALVAALAHWPGGERLRIVHQTGAAMHASSARRRTRRPGARPRCWRSSTTWRRASPRPT